MAFSTRVGSVFVGGVSFLMFLVRTFCGGRVELPPRRGRRDSWREPMIRWGVGLGRCDIVCSRARSCARAPAVRAFFSGAVCSGGLCGRGCSCVEKIQHSVSGARVRSTYVAAKESGGGEGEGGKVARMWAEGGEEWNWMRRRRGSEVGRWGRRWGVSVWRGEGWWWVWGRRMDIIGVEYGDDFAERKKCFLFASSLNGLVNYLPDS